MPLSKNVNQILSYLILIYFVTGTLGGCRTVKQNKKTNPPVTAVSMLTAAVEGDSDTVRYLLDQNPDLVNVREITGGLTPLHWAARPGQDGRYRLFGKYDEVVKLLVEKEADVNEKTLECATPLHTIASYKVPSGKWSVQVNSKPYPQHLRKMQIRSLQYVINGGADVNVKGPKDYTPLHIAISRGYKDIVLLLVENGADLQAKTEDDVTVCAVAKERSYKKIIEICHLFGNAYYLDKKANVKEETPEIEEPEDKRHPLHNAVRSGEVASVEKILKKGVEIDRQDDTSQTALHVAADYQDTVMAKLLLEKGAKIDLQNKDGQTALHLAARHGDTAMAHLLLERGANIDFRDTNGRTPLHLMARYGGYGDGPSTLAHALLDKGATVNLQDNYGQIALHLAAEHGEIAVVHALLDKGGAVDLQDIIGRTALHLAAEQGEIAVVQALLDKGAAVDLQDKIGRTALHLAAKSETLLNQATKLDFLSIVQLLLNEGAKVDLTDKFGQTALSAAGSEDIAQRLKTAGAK